METGFAFAADKAMGATSSDQPNQHFGKRRRNFS
jgi:hypothetical protein